MTVEYLLSEEGLRQNFIIDERPAGSGALELHFQLNTPLCPELEGSTGIAFSSIDGRLQHAYRDLHVWDACGNVLEARFLLMNGSNDLSIVVMDEDAIYPITVDPVATTANRVLNAPVGGYFGWSSANAGDVNGDGYSDVIVGAWGATSGETGEGLAFVYYGSPTGIPSAPSITLQADQAGANFGYSVDGAGDVNGDGYSDVIVGASAWESSAAEDKEGAAFIYHGSAAGLSTVPAVILQPNGVNKYMGYCVAGLGDINGDGYSDVAAGGHLANYPSVSGNEGVGWIFLGSATGVNPVYRHRLERDQTAAQFAGTIGPAGDVNGDGYNDVIIGAHRFELNASPCPPPTAPVNCDDGAIFIYHGSANALGAGANPAPNTIFNTNGYSVRTGWAVSTAGDVNGDGYSDIIIGDWRDSVGVEQYEGSAFIYHGSATGINTIPATILQTDQEFSFFGRNVSTAGDVNGDGYADVIVGATQWSNGQNLEGGAFVYLGSSTGINSSVYRRYESNVINAQMGESVSTAGDVNGDGYSDMIVGISSPTFGTAQIFHGGTSNVSPTPSFSRASGMAGATLGAAVGNAGDVNGDGYTDAIFGAPGGSIGQAGEGLAYVHYGSANGLSAAPSLTFQANIANAEYGASVASAGDVNGDGYADVVIGAPNSGGTGQAYVYHGGAAGLSIVPALLLTGTAGSRFGASVFTAGDVNADGYADLLVGAPGSDLVQLCLGSATGLNPTPHQTFTGTIPGSGFGSSVCTAGDVNGDGYSDIVIGAPEFSNGQLLEGAAYVFLGDETQVTNTPQLTIELNNADRRIGASVAGVGDMDGDGFSEILLGAPLGDSGQTNEGLAFMFRGSPAGSTFTGLVILQSNQDNALFGTSVAEAGDVNGDGYADGVIGAPFYTNGQANEGQVWVVLGAPVVTGTFTAVELNAAGMHLGKAVAGGGDTNGDGYSDIITGAPEASPTLANEGSVHLFRGNNAEGYNRLSRQYLADLVSPLSTNSDDYTSTLFGIGHLARSPIQRTTAKLRWEVVHEGQPFSGIPITNSVAADANSAVWTDLGLAGVEIKQLILKTPPFIRHKWRARVEYPMHKMIDGQRFSRWFYGYASAVGDIGILPIELLTFDGMALTDGNLLEWSTATERNSSHFLVERSTDGIMFEPIGSVPAAGESTQLHHYELLDPEAPSGVAYYRLLMIDRDGAEGISPTIAISREAANVLVYPVPVDDALHWNLPNAEVVRVVIKDALGRIVLDRHISDQVIRGNAIRELATGTYAIMLFDANNAVVGRSRFLKK